jgi:hypothetical protein
VRKSDRIYVSSQAKSYWRDLPNANDLEFANNLSLFVTLLFVEIRVANLRETSQFCSETEKY